MVATTDMPLKFSQTIDTIHIEHTLKMHIMVN